MIATPIGSWSSAFSIRATNAPQTLERLATEDTIQGIRLSIRVGEDWLADAALAPLWRRAAELHLPLILQVTKGHLPSLIGVARRFPETRLVIDHVAMVNLAAVPPFADLVPLFTATGCTNLYVKTSHLYGLDRPDAAERHIPELLRRLKETLGADRLLFGSKLAAGVRTRRVAVLRERFPGRYRTFSPREQQAILAGTARALYRWGTTPIAEGDGNAAHR